MHRTHSSLLLLLLVTLVSAPPILAQNLVMPLGHDTVEGADASSLPFNCSSEVTDIRYMQVYDGTTVGTGIITEIRFRQDGVLGNDFLPVGFFGNMSVMSTASPVDGLDPIVGNNFSPDFQSAWQGAPISSTSDGGDPPHFDIAIPFLEPFKFDATSGRNFLIDVVMVFCGFTTPFDAVDSPDDGVSRLFVTPFNTTTTTDLDTVGLVTEIIFDPAVLFLNGFESGNTSSWSTAVP